MPADLKLVYFDLRGRAEPVRLMLAAAGVKYDEDRISFADWPKLKPTTPYGSLPYIIYKGKTLGQSSGVAVFVAKEYGMFGKTSVDAARIMETWGLWEDQLVGGFAKIRFGADDAAKAAATKKTLEEDLPKFFGYYERFLKENGSTGFVVQKSVSMADCYLYDMIENVLQLKSDALKDFPLLTKLKANVEANPKIKAYLAKRKETPF